MSLPSDLSAPSSEHAASVGRQRWDGICLIWFLNLFSVLIRSRPSGMADDKFR